jgi:hypothetical protein
MHPYMDVLALTPLGPIGLGQAEAASPSSGPLGLAPLSPVPTASIDRAGRCPAPAQTTTPPNERRPAP